MSNPNFCLGASTIKGAVGNDCNPGFPVGLLYSDEKTDPVLKVSATLKETWTALQKTNSLLYIPIEDIDTPVSYETTKYTNSQGAETPTNQIKKAGVFTVVGGPCSKNFGKKFATQQTGYVFIVMSTGAIVGKELSADSFEQIKASLHAVPMPGTKEKPWQYQLNYNELEKWENNMFAVQPEDGFDPQLLRETNLRNMTLTDGSTNTLTTQSVFAWNPCGEGITDLDITGASNFKVYDVTTGANKAVSGASQVGSTNEYIVTFATVTEADKIKTYYDDPSNTDELWYCPIENAVQTTQTA